MNLETKSSKVSSLFITVVCIIGFFLIFITVYFLNDLPFTYVPNERVSLQDINAHLILPDNAVKDYYDSGELKSEMDPVQGIKKSYNKNGILSSISTPQKEIAYSYYFYGNILESIHCYDKDLSMSQKEWYYKNGAVKRKVAKVFWQIVLDETYDEKGRFGAYRKYRPLLVLYFSLCTAFLALLLVDIVGFFLTSDKNIKISKQLVLLNTLVILQILLFYFVCEGIIDEESRGSWGRLGGGVVALLVLPAVSLVSFIFAGVLLRNKELRLHLLICIGISVMMICFPLSINLAECFWEWWGH